MGQKEDHLREKEQQKKVEQMNLKTHLASLSSEYRNQVSIGDVHRCEKIHVKQKLLQEIYEEVRQLDLKTIQNKQDILTFACQGGGSHTENKRRAIALCVFLQSKESKESKESEGQRYRITSWDIANHRVYE
jgi:hypothetical protein